MRIFCGLSRVNFDDFADLDLVDGSEDFRNERQEIAHACSRPSNDDRRNPDLREILLIRQALIGGNDHSKTGIDRSSQQNAIPQAAPAPLPNRGHLMPRQFVRKLNRQRLVDQNTQTPSPPRTRSPAPLQPDRAQL